MLVCGLLALTPSGSWARHAGAAPNSRTQSGSEAAGRDSVGTARLPDTQAGKRVAGFLEAFNAGQEAEMRVYLEANLSPEGARQRPVEGRLQALRQIREDTGVLELERITRVREDALTVVARGGTGKWLEISFAFEAEPPHRFLGARFELLEGPPSPEGEGPPLNETQLVAELSAYLDSLARRDEFSGVVLLARPDVTVFRRAFGTASKEYGVPNRAETRFNLGSINKLFTRIAVEQLAARGALTLDDTIGKFLPDYSNAEAAAKVTVRHLLEMTSGIGDFFGQRYADTPKDRIRDLVDYLPLFASDSLAFEPGTSSAYSNGGYVVLGLIVEKASGQTYFDYVREHICAPAGMESTGHLEADVPVPDVASGYTHAWGQEERRGEPRRNNIYTRPARGSSAGGGYSNADDLLRLVLALKAGKLSAPEASREVSEGGIAVAGGAPGISAYLEAQPGVGYTTVVLSNYDPPAAVRVGRKVAKMLERLE